MNRLRFTLTVCFRRQAGWIGLIWLFSSPLHTMAGPAGTVQSQVQAQAMAEPPLQTQSLESRAPLQIAWLSNLYPEHSFWRLHLAFSQAVANDQGIRLIPFYLHQDQIRYRQVLADITRSTGARPKEEQPQFDGVIFSNLKHQERALLSVLDNGHIPGITNVLPMDYDRVGQPRERYSRWIGEILVDETRNGYLLAQRLITEARHRQLYADDGKLHLVAIAGNKADSVGILRERGLKQALAEHSDVILKQLFYSSNWSRDEAAVFTRTALRRYPQTSVFWSANDDIAIGVITAARSMLHQPGIQLLTGGIDGTPEMLEKIAAGEAVCTVSGLFMNGGWALVLLFDYLQGRDFVDDTGAVIEVNNLLVDQATVGQYLPLFTSQQSWERIDFTRYSKTFNPGLRRYMFSVQAILDQ